MAICDTREELEIFELNSNVEEFIHHWRNTVSYKEETNLKQYILYRDTRFEIVTTMNLLGCDVV
jgi:hypothetical protein